MTAKFREVESESGPGGSAGMTTRRQLLALPALAHTPVATNRHVYAYEDQYLYGFGPRTGQLLAQLIRDIQKPT